jgi:hypothetical protein
MNGWAAELISPEVADKVGKVWGLGSNTTKDPGPWEGEPRNMWSPPNRRRYGSMAETWPSHATISQFPVTADQGATGRYRHNLFTERLRCIISRE